MEATLIELVGGEFDGQRLRMPVLKPEIEMVDAEGRARSLYRIRTTDEQTLIGGLTIRPYSLSDDGEAVLFDLVDP